MASYITFNFAQSIGACPVKIDVQRGKFSYSTSKASVFIHNVLYFLVSFKVAHELCALVVGMAVLDDSSLASTFFLAVNVSLHVTALQWSRHCFQVALEETILIFNTLELSASKIIYSAKSTILGVAGLLNLKH